MTTIMAQCHGVIVFVTSWLAFLELPAYFIVSPQGRACVRVCGDYYYILLTLFLRVCLQFVWVTSGHHLFTSGL